MIRLILILLSVIFNSYLFGQIELCPIKNKKVDFCLNIELVLEDCKKELNRQKRKKEEGIKSNNGKNWSESQIGEYDSSIKKLQKIYDHINDKGGKLGESDLNDLSKLIDDFKKESNWILRNTTKNGIKYSKVIPELKNVVSANLDVTDEDEFDEDVSDEDVSDEDEFDEDVSDEDVSDEDVSDEDVSDEDVSDEDVSGSSILKWLTFLFGLISVCSIGFNIYLKKKNDALKEKIEHNSQLNQANIKELNRNTNNQHRENQTLINQLKLANENVSKLKKEKNELRAKLESYDQTAQQSSFKSKTSTPPVPQSELKTPPTLRRGYLQMPNKKTMSFRNQSIKDNITPYTYFVFTQTSEIEGSFQVIESNDVVQAAIDSVDSIILPVCTVEGGFNVNAKRIRNIQAGTLRFDGSEWRVDKKCIIAFE